jgi:DNA processing protein
MRAMSVAHDAQRRWLEHPGHHLLPCTDVRYPPLLASLSGGPRMLYVGGSLAALGKPQLAIVGSRNPTPQGREIAREFAASLALRGMAVASGLAEGIDAAAHRGALDAQGTTLAVLACGLDVIYPPGNAQLAAAIERGGALVSEFPPGTPPRRAHFARRNRLLAALACGTLVVEAASRSGSLITARAARTLGRRVFAIPGSIRSPLSRGCHELIRQGAGLVEEVDDILSALGFSPLFGACGEPGARSAAPAPCGTGMDKGHKILLDAVGFEAVDIDTLVVRTGFKAEAVSSMMLILELEGHVQAAPGGRYSRANRRAGGERERSRSAHLSVRELHER